MKNNIFILVSMLLFLFPCCNSEPEKTPVCTDVWEEEPVCAEYCEESAQSVAVKKIAPENVHLSGPFAHLFQITDSVRLSLAVYEVTGGPVRVLTVECPYKTLFSWTHEWDVKYYPQLEFAISFPGGEEVEYRSNLGFELGCLDYVFPNSSAYAAEFWAYESLEKCNDLWYMHVPIPHLVKDNVYGALYYNVYDNSDNWELDDGEQKIRIQFYTNAVGIEDLRREAYSCRHPFYELERCGIEPRPEAVARAQELERRVQELERKHQEFEEDVLVQLFEEINDISISNIGLTKIKYDKNIDVFLSDLEKKYVEYQHWNGKDSMAYYLEIADYLLRVQRGLELALDLMPPTEGGDRGFVHEVPHCGYSFLQMKRLLKWREKEWNYNIHIFDMKSIEKLAAQGNAQAQLIVAKSKINDALLTSHYRFMDNFDPDSFFAGLCLFLDLAVQGNEEAIKALEMLNDTYPMDYGRGYLDLWELFSRSDIIDKAFFSPYDTDIKRKVNQKMSSLTNKLQQIKPKLSAGAYGNYNNFFQSKGAKLCIASSLSSKRLKISDTLE